MKRSKAYRKAAELVDEDHIYAPLEAAQLAKQTSPTKYDATSRSPCASASTRARPTDGARHRQPATWHRQDAKVIFCRAGDKAAEAEARGR